MGKGHYLAWHMGLEKPRYLLVPESLDDVRGEQRFESVREDGVPLAPIFARKHHVCSLRRPGVPDGQECEQERALVREFLDNYKRGRDMEENGGGLEPPTLLLTTRMPEWSGWR